MEEVRYAVRENSARSASRKVSGCALDIPHIDVVVVDKHSTDKDSCVGAAEALDWLPTGFESLIHCFHQQSPLWIHQVCFTGVYSVNR